MTVNDQIRPLADLPDHGFGPLGRLVHSVLAEYAGVPLNVPRLHLGQNTLPNPPFEMSAQVPFGCLDVGWHECQEDLATFLRSGIAALRSQPIPDSSAYPQEVRILQRVLRFDSIVMAWHDPGRAAFSLLALAVDRVGNALSGWIRRGGTAADIEVAGEPVDDVTVALLHEVLQAQYDWTTAAFGLLPEDHDGGDGESSPPS